MVKFRTNDGDIFIRPEAVLMVQPLRGGGGDVFTTIRPEPFRVNDGPGVIFGSLGIELSREGASEADRVPPSR